jgi:hypothetical protein
MINQTLCTSFKRELLLGVHDFRVSGGDTFKIALYTANADLGAGTTAYTSAGEVSGPGYVAGGIVLTSEGTASNNATGYANFLTATFPAATLTARGALIYNTTPSALGPGGVVLINPAVCVLDFGADRTASNSTFTIQFPANTAESAIIRIG